MDLATLQPTERQVEILSPGTKQPIGVRVTLVHIDDPRLKQLKRKFQDERTRLEQRGKFFKAEQIESNSHELGFAAMTGWEWYNPTGEKTDKGFDETKRAEWKGEKSPPFNKKTVFEVFETLPWFLEQIGQEMGDSEAFFPN